MGASKNKCFGLQRIYIVTIAAVANLVSQNSKTPGENLTKHTTYVI